MSKVTIVVGAQWGDEGKGKWVDYKAKHAKIIARYQGGNNAGHTLYEGNEKIVLHQIPSGILQDQKICALGAGVVMNPVALVEEMQQLEKFKKLTPDNFWISKRAHVISPWQVALDGSRESRTTTPIGTTKRGIGPTYSDKAARIGIQVGSYIDESTRKQWFESYLPENTNDSSLEAAKEHWQAFNNAAEVLKPFVCDADAKIRDAIYQDEDVLLEGAQGTLLDLNHGTYPYVTSSSTCAGGAVANIGFAAKYVHRVVGIAKAYVTRVGEGPFPTELFDENGKALAEKGNEFGATTGRPRRCGWLDLVALRYAVRVNGLDEIIFNKFDILGDFAEIKAATSYSLDGVEIPVDEFPASALELARCQANYKTFPGWKSNDVDIKAQKLPQTALNYIKFVEEFCGCEISFVGLGVGRNDFYKPNNF